MSDTNDPPAEQFSPGISVITITLDHEEGTTSLNIGDLGVHTAWGLLLAAADAVSARLPEPRFGDDDGDEPEDGDKGDDVDERG